MTTEITINVDATTVELKQGKRRASLTSRYDIDGIVRCVNAHEELVAALSKIVNNWGDLHPKDRQQARAALEKARGSAS